MKAEVSLGLGVAAAAVALAIYQNATPTIADIRVAPANDDHIDGARKLATWTAAGVVVGLAVLAKDMTVFVIGGAAVVGLDWWHRHANALDPDTGRLPLLRRPKGASDATQMVSDQLTG